VSGGTARSASGAGSTSSSGIASASGPGSAELHRAREILADGEWHDYEALLRELMRMVPPGRAARAAERHRVGQAVRRARYRGTTLDGVPAPNRVNDPDRVRDTGARLLVRKVLSDAGFEIAPLGRAPDKKIRDRRALAAEVAKPRPGGSPA
jgi:hypothetical protein